MKKLLTLTTLLYLVFCCDITGQTISKLEYFMNTDPGVGNGTSFTATPADSVTVNVPININSLPSGFYKIGIRAMYSTGAWSHAEFRSLFIMDIPSAANQQIIQGEYYFGDTDPGLGNAAPVSVINPADSITIIEDSVLNNLPQGQYKINIRFRDARGVWSHQETRIFTVCSTYGAQSEFTYQVEGNRIFFTNNSLYQDTVSWKFGDNTTDTVFNPIKTYANAGVYNVQLITGNPCGIDTLTQAIEIRGLQRVNPNRAGNAGISTLAFEGFGFTGSTEVKLILGAQVFTPISKTFINNNRIRANFNFTGFATGYYRAVAVLGSGFDTLNNAVLIEQNIPVNLVLSTTKGRGMKRPGRLNSYGTIFNQGSHDAVMVPYVFGGNVLPGVPINRNPFIQTSQVFLQNEGIFQHTTQYITNNNVPAEVMLGGNLDSARGRQIVGYYKVKVPGHASKTELIWFTQSPGVSYSYQTGNAILGPLLDSYALQDSINTDYQPCYSAFLKRAVEKELNVSVNSSSWNNCFATAFDTLMRTLANISQNPILENFMVPMQAGFSALLAQMAGCPGSGVPAGLGGIQFKRIVQHVMNNWVYLEDVDSLDTDCLDTTVQIYTRINQGSIESVNTSGQRIAGICNDQCPGANVFPEMCEQCLPFILAGKVGEKLEVNGHAWAANSAVTGCQEWCETTSIDPNAKYGPGNNNDRKYINHRKDVLFKITFENLATATAPAAYVEVRDTIDKTVFDMSTLQLENFSWGDSLITADPNEQNVSILKNIKPAHPNFLRIDATTDTAQGVVVWKFWTIDTVTLQLTTDPAEGFLPPNTDGVSGAGFVSFSIAPKASITNGTMLKNKASIVFDDNVAIITNEWEYRTDTLQPSSSVSSLPATTPTATFNVNWSGTDTHAGIDRYSVYVSVNDSAYKVWQSLTDQTSASFTGQFGKTYKFFSVALDKAGNYEDPPADAINNPDAVTIIQGPLPLNLLSFTAVKTADNKKVNLNWETTNEQNVSHFVVERSADRLSYSGIAAVPARNNTNGASYQWQDINPLSKVNYYRLKIVDFDSTSKFSPVKMVRFANDGEILVFPTVVSDLVFIQSEKEVTAVLFNTTGQKLESKTFRSNGSFDLRSYPAGLYFIRIENRVYKLIKQ